MLIEHVTSGGEVHKQGCMETRDHIMIAANIFQIKKPELNLRKIVSRRKT